MRNFYLFPYPAHSQFCELRYVQNSLLSQ
jgi:hypothetical protein